ncbi:sensor histidine kinase [Marinomonas spartinae]|nr:HAMP domain-containing sensor histidine kinase [Marinomonas spartinae]
MKMWFFTVYSRLRQSILESVEYSLPHSFYIGLIGTIGFPLYYWVWSYAFPQPYESLTLRLVGSLLFLGLALLKFWPDWLRPYTTLYWLLTMIYSLPFFFMYMLLMNEGNITWGMSMTAALSILILVAYNWVSFVTMLSSGSVLALTAYILTTDKIIFSNYLSQLPVYLFLIVAGSAFYFPYRVKQEKLKVLASVGAEISHELRTPLMTIRNHTYGLSKNLPELLRVYKLAQANNLTTPPLRPDVFMALERSIQQIDNEVRHSNTVIDMLLMNVRKPKINTEEFGYFSMSDIIRQAIDRYPFDSSRERSIIRVDLNKDFCFLGSDILMMHVIFNLIKNALVFTNSNPEANIEITLDNADDTNRIYFRDNGRGVAPKDKNSIFENFYSSGNQVIGTGTGIGLSFCKKILATFNASIKCESELEKFTKFILTFPQLKPSSN